MIQFNEQNAERQQKIVVTVVGKDRVGIIARISNLLAEHQINILDIRQSILQDFFTMIMIVDAAGGLVDFNTLSSMLEQKGEEIGVKITAQHEDVFNYMHRI